MFLGALIKLIYPDPVPIFSDLPNEISLPIEMPHLPGRQRSQITQQKYWMNTESGVQTPCHDKRTTVGVGLRHQGSFSKVDCLLGLIALDMGSLPNAS